ncbi:hypothetical protein K0M31_007243 [Melipona bicolor]|uniref:DUF4550 domain-containing protein n=1 Tax=Melipona bicolor TaxID=60889 RepID=A0AA40KVS6_9HYME|nr:hypothetical protein K0M31_007243 [Melipona bicolor]
MHLILTFGFSISIKSNSNLENDKNTNKDKVKNVRQRKEKEISKNEFKITQSSKNFIHVDQILAEIHVEYELLPNYNFKFDCRCWETATKIYIENDDFCLRPIVCPIEKNTYWVLFSVHHLVHLNEMQLRKFFNYVIICKIFYGKQKFSERAKKDKVKGFYIDNKSIHVGLEEFVELYHSNLTKRSSPSLLQTIITDEIYGDFSMTTYFDVIPDMGTITTYNRTLQLPSISSILMYAQCQNILSDKQLRMNLNPISIKLQKLSNFPADIIIENDKIMYFEFIKCFLCEEFQLKELINFLATKFLTIEVIGIRIIGSLTSTSNRSDYEKSIPKSLEASTKEEILLGVVEFDVSDLLRGFWEVKLTNNLIHPRNIFVTNTDYKNDETIKISWENSPLPTDIFTLYNTSMNIKIRPAYDLRIVQKKIIQNENMWNRIFLNLNNLELANDILKDVSFYNSNLLTTVYESSKERNNLKVKF